ncbi:hypothetical protein CRM22_002584 [Opisthorchis felineus]|uniref:Uncharacterized protein n=1 Tax=Opisthorchis felineus TaxID=147828 RepID=A0A4S2M5B1_OPIFE|nr:hypothetical protein CRM22_002584 [Opisthorchis felineus]
MELNQPDGLQHYVTLSEEPTIFEPMSSVNSVFFDTAQQQIFTLRSRGIMGVNVKSPDSSRPSLNFRIEDHGEVLCIKFSPDSRVLAIQRTPHSIDFLNFSNGSPISSEYSHTCKGKKIKLLGFVWTTATEILLVTTESLELYQVLPTKRSLRLEKQLFLHTLWFTWDATSHVLVACTKNTELLCHTFHLKTAGAITKICKFSLPSNLALDNAQPDTVSAILQNSCLLACIYGNVYLLIAHEGDESDQDEAASTTISMYKFSGDGLVKLTDELLVESNGQFAISLVDNVVLVHCRNERVTCVYDLAFGGHVHNGISKHRPVFPPESIGPLTLASNTVPALSSNLDAKIPIELYSPHWVTNLPSVVIDGNLGCLWTLKLNNKLIPRLIRKRPHIVDFLVNREDGKRILLDYCTALYNLSVSEALSYETSDFDGDYSFHADGLNQRLDDFAYIFKRFAELRHPHSRRKSPVHSTVVGPYASFSTLPADEETENSAASRKMSMAVEDGYAPAFQRPFTVSQSDVYTHIFLVAQGNENPHVRSLLYAVLVEYIRSLVEHEIHVDHSVHELLVSTIARLEQYDQLSYCIQSRLLADSKPIALQLLALESVYPAAGQLAIDMLKRLSFSNEEVVELLLLKNRLIEALRRVLRPVDRLAYSAARIRGSSSELSDSSNCNVRFCVAGCDIPCCNTRTQR